MNNTTLHLILKRPYFDMILKGIKKEEYREIKPHWDKGLAHLFPQTINGQTYFPIVETITFSNGYRKDRLQLVIELKGISKKFGNVEWGAIKNTLYYTLQLGSILKYGKQGFLFNVNDKHSVEFINEIVR